MFDGLSAFVHSGMLRRTAACGLPSSEQPAATYRMPAILHALQLPVNLSHRLLHAESGHQCLASPHDEKQPKWITNEKKFPGLRMSPWLTATAKGELLSTTVAITFSQWLFLFLWPPAGGYVFTSVCMSQGYLKKYWIRVRLRVSGSVGHRPRTHLNKCLVEIIQKSVCNKHLFVFIKICL